MFDDFSSHLELESTCLEVAKAHGSMYVVEGISHKGLSPKCRNFRKTAKKKSNEGLKFDKTKNTKHKQGKHDEKCKASKACFNHGEET